MKKIFLLIVAGLTLVMMQSCATMFSGTKDKISFKSMPSGAKIIFDGKEQGVTPTDIIVSRKIYPSRKGIMVQLQKDGYKTLEFNMECKIAVGYWLDMPWFFAGLLPGLIFSMIDVYTGAMYKPRYFSYEKSLTPSK